MYSSFNANISVNCFKEDIAVNCSRNLVRSSHLRKLNIIWDVVTEKKLLLKLSATPCSETQKSLFSVSDFALFREETNERLR